MSCRCGRGQRVLQIGSSFICFTGLPEPGQHISVGLHFWNDQRTMNPIFPNSASMVPRLRTMWSSPEADLTSSPTYSSVSFVEEEGEGQSDIPRRDFLKDERDQS